MASAVGHSKKLMPKRARGGKGQHALPQSCDYIDERQLMYQIVLSDSDQAKAKLGIKLDKAHIYGAVIFSCQARNKKVPTILAQFFDRLSKGSTCVGFTSCTLAMGLLSGHEMDVMDLNLLKQDVALIWAYWGIIQAGSAHEKIARLCPYFVDMFLELFDPDANLPDSLHDDDADWTFFPGMRNNRSTTPNMFAPDPDDWKERYVDHLKENLQNLIATLKRGAVYCEHMQHGQTCI